MNKEFAGNVDVYDENFYVDTRTGEGLDLVLDKIDPLLCKMASKTYIPGYFFDDIKQELAAIAINGIRSYNPKKKVKLSTFLHIHLRNKLISKIRSKNKMSKDAFGLDDLNMYACKCGSTSSPIEESVLLKDGSCEIKVSCPDCQSVLSKKTRKIREEILFTQIRTSNNEKSDEINFEDMISDEESMYGSGASLYRQVDFIESLNKLSESIDEKTARIVELICLEDYSIKDAASEVGLSGWAASMRLKNLSKNKVIRDMFDKKK
tara:strand:+ start:8613 stop:9404 length:792 start_codon:yes stop_codon:yes gene_type:complete